MAPAIILLKRLSRVASILDSWTEFSGTSFFTPARQNGSIKVWRLSLMLCFVGWSKSFRTVSLICEGLRPSFSTSGQTRWRRLLILTWISTNVVTVGNPSSAPIDLGLSVILTWRWSIPQLSSWMRLAVFVPNIWLKTAMSADCSFLMVSISRLSSFLYVEDPIPGMFLGEFRDPIRARENAGSNVVCWLGLWVAQTSLARSLLWAIPAQQDISSSSFSRSLISWAIMEPLISRALHPHWHDSFSLL